MVPVVVVVVVDNNGLALCLFWFRVWNSLSGIHDMQSAFRFALEVFVESADGMFKNIF